MQVQVKTTNGLHPPPPSVSVDVPHRPKTTKVVRDHRPPSQYIRSSNLCAKCVYNIPTGTSLCLFPGIMLFCVGVVIFAWTSSDNPWDTMTRQVGIIFLVIGGSFTTIGIVVCVHDWRADKRAAYPKQPKFVLPKNVKLTKKKPIYVIRVSCLTEDQVDNKETPKRKKITPEELQQRLNERAKKKALEKKAKMNEGILLNVYVNGGYITASSTPQQSQSVSLELEDSVISNGITDATVEP